MRTSLLTVFVVTTAASGCGGGAPEVRGVADGEYEELTFSRTHFKGSCVDRGTLVEAVLTSDGLMRGTYLMSPDEASGPCAEGTLMRNCAVAVTIDEWEVDPDTQKEIEQLVGDIPAPQCQPGEFSCDPCRVTTIAIDGYELDDTCCGQLNAAFVQQFEATMETVEDVLRTRFESEQM